MYICGEGAYTSLQVSPAAEDAACMQPAAVFRCPIQ